MSTRSLSIKSLLLGALQLGASYAGDAAFWRKQSIYQIITDRFSRTDGSNSVSCDTGANPICGGTWRGIINQLDYIQGMGMTAIWISPVSGNLQGNTKEGTAYHGYWLQDLYSVNSNFGTEQDLKDLGAALHARNMSLMVDAIVNHFAWAGDHSSVDYSKFNPLNDQKYFHSYCDLNGLIETASPSNATDILRHCWLGDDIVSLPDIRTEDEVVQKMLQSWIGELVSNYSIDGLRIDAAKHVDPSFFPPFLEAAGNVFGMGEVLDQDSGTACTWAKGSIGSVLNYPIYFPLVKGFGSTNGSLTGIVEKMSDVLSVCGDPTVLGNFAESHDVDRFAQYTDDMSLAKNIMAFNFLTDGIPIVYQGQEQHQAGKSNDNSNRQALWLGHYMVNSPLYKLTTSLNLIRKQAISKDETWVTSNAKVIQSSGNTMAISKGPSTSRTVVVLSNLGEDTSYVPLTVKMTADNGYTTGTNLTDVLTCRTVMVGDDGSITAPIIKGEPIIYWPTTLLNGTGFCGASKPPRTATTTASSYTYTDPASSGATVPPWRSTGFARFAITSMPLLMAFLLFY